MQDSEKNWGNDWDNLVQQRAIRLFQFLRRVSQLRSSQVRAVEDYQQVLWLNTVPVSQGCFCTLRLPEHERGDVWLEIEMPVFKPVPALPHGLHEVVDFEKLTNSECALPQLKDLLFEVGDASAIENASLTEAFNAYLLQHWFPWAEHDKKNQTLRPLCEKLQDIHQTLQTNPESYELVACLGLLSYKTPSGEVVRRHLLTLPVTLSFDARTRHFRVKCAEDSRWEMDEDVADLLELPGLALSDALREKLFSFAEIVWDETKFEDFFSSWLSSCTSRGTYDSSFDMPDPAKMPAHPAITLAPALVLRRRTDHGFIRFVDALIGRLAADGNVPCGLERFINVIDDRAFQPDENQPNALVYFSLAANPEQVQIADSLKTRQGVLVQGPPGTGKSQTIANLICHLLALGKRVLVTSHTARALRVLRDKLPDEIKPLCIAVIGDGNAETRSTLESSISVIQNRHAIWSPEKCQSTIQKLEDDLAELKTREDRLDTILVQSRNLDVLVYTDKFGYSGSAEAIARQVCEERVLFSWFTDSPHESEDPPIGASECIELLSLVRTYPPSKVQKRTFVAPSAKLPSADAFARNVVRLQQLQERLSSISQSYKEHTSYNASVSLSTEVRESLANEINEVLMISGPLMNRKEPWVKNCVQEILCEQDRTWRELFGVTKAQLEKIGDSYRTFAPLKVTGLEGRDLHTVLVQCEELRMHMAAGKSLGIGPFRPRPVKEGLYLLSEVRLNGKVADNVSVLQELSDYLRFKIMVDDLCTHWTGVDVLSSENLLQTIPKLIDYCEPLNVALELFEKLKTLKSELRKYKLIEPDWSNVREVTLFKDVLLCARIAEEIAGLEESNNQLQAYIESTRARPDSHTVNELLSTAVSLQDPKKYAEGLEQLVELEKQNRDRARRDELLVLSGYSKANRPSWLTSLLDSPDDPRWHERLQNFEKAWNNARAEKWIQLLYVIETDSEVLREQSEIKHLKDQTIAKLAAELGWSHFLGRMQEQQRQSLDAWKKAVSRIGKGTGKHAERHRKSAREHMLQCRESIPAWIMPMHMLLQTIEPEPESFDVVIVDEASQSGPDALVLSYIAKQLVVVGDDKQISPDFVGLDRDEVEKLRREYLNDIPFSDAIGVDNSFFDLAQIRYAGKIRLREHFRCMPEIIAFSNRLCYMDQPLVPLKQFGSSRIAPVLASVFVNTKGELTETKSVNLEEAESLLQKMLELSQKPEYREKTFGVISLLSTSRQVEYLRRRISEVFSAEEIESRRIICGDPYDFQGDERDVVFLSLVAKPPISGRKAHAMSSEKDERRFNVAASRAKEQLWLFHSLQISDLNPKCVRYRLLEHFSITQREHAVSVKHTAATEPPGRLTTVPAPFRSRLAYDVCLTLQQHGYAITPGQTLGGCDIDLFVEGASRRIALQCHNDQWHSAAQYLHQLKLEQALERCQMPFLRTKGSAFYLDREKWLKNISKELKKFNVLPVAAPEHQIPVALSDSITDVASIP